MPVQDIRMSEGEIIDALESEFRSEMGNDIDLTESSVFTTFAEVLSAVLSGNQEQSIQEVYESGFLETAEGADLDRVVAIVGIQRRSAVHSTGVQRFSSNTPVTSDYTVQRGTVIQTDGDDSRQFETTESTQLKYIDGFESGSLSDDYSGDETAFSVVNDQPSEGLYELRADPTDGAHIYGKETVEEGTTIHVDIRPELDTVPIFTFGVNEDGDEYYQISFDSIGNEVSIEKVEGSTVSQIIDTRSADIPVDEYSHAEIDWNVTGQISVTLADEYDGEEIVTAGGYDSNDYEDRINSGYIGFKSGDNNGYKYFDEATTSAVSANIRASMGGSVGNVGRNSITVMPSPPTGVHSTTNLYPTGDRDFHDKDGEPFRIGEAEETDIELRDRARDSVSGGGDATADSIIDYLLNEVEDVRSVNVYENKEDTEDADGMPPFSFETIVYGGEDDNVAEAIFEKKALTARDVGGIRGVEVTESVYSDVNDQRFEITFSRPDSLDITLETDIVVDETYIGDDELKDEIVSYIGGENTDDITEIGLGVGEDVYMDQVREIVVGQRDTGVVGFDMNTSDYEIDTTPTTSTDDNGLEVISVGDNEVPQIDAADITIRTTEVGE